VALIFLLYIFHS